MTRVILIHGNGGSTGRDHWFPWLVAELHARGVEALAPDFPDARLARARYWLPFLESLGADHQTVLIGHSSGAVAALRYAQDHDLAGLVLVGACHTDLGDPAEKASGYYDEPWPWQRIAARQPWVVQFHSTDDPYIPIDEARYIHDHLGTEYYEFSDRGHFGGDREYMQFPELLTAVVARLGISDDT